MNTNKKVLALIAAVGLGLVATPALAATSDMYSLYTTGPQTGTSASGCAFTYDIYSGSHYASTTRTYGSSCWQVKVRHLYYPGGSGVYTPWVYVTYGTATSPANAYISRSYHQGCFTSCPAGW